MIIKQLTKMNQAYYFNRALNETFILDNIKDLEEAWDNAELVCKKKNWNYSMFAYDVVVRLKEN